MSVGDVLDHEPGFVPWELSLSAALERIRTEWTAGGGQLQMGEVCWLANTPEGDAHAETVRDEVNARRRWPPGDLGTQWAASTEKPRRRPSGSDETG